MSVIKDADSYLKKQPSLKTWGDHDTHLRRVLARAKELEIALYAYKNHLSFQQKEITEILNKKQ